MWGDLRLDQAKVTAGKKNHIRTKKQIKTIRSDNEKTCSPGGKRKRGCRAEILERDRRMYTAETLIQYACHALPLRLHLIGLVKTFP